MYCDYILGYDCADIDSYYLFEVLSDGLSCLFDEGFITDIQYDNLLISLEKVRSNYV